MIEFGGQRRGRPKATSPCVRRPKNAVLQIQDFEFEGDSSFRGFEAYRNLTVGLEPLARPRQFSIREAGEEGGHVSYRRIGAPQFQRELSGLLDLTKARRLDITLQQQGVWPQLDRSHELRDKNVSHKWLTHLDVKTRTTCSTSEKTRGQSLHWRSCVPPLRSSPRRAAGTW